MLDPDLILSRQCIQCGPPTGYICSNGVVTIWSGHNFNNIATLYQALNIFPELRLIGDLRQGWEF